uniref:Enoyl-CoA hydratase domain-containing protein 3, mitochondrial n=1 Tax=Stomoxys calcitrans TaxID=35570 RepID=A0A1I8PMP7_STOCA
MLSHRFLLNRTSLSAVANNLCAFKSAMSMSNFKMSNSSAPTQRHTSQYCQISESDGIREICLNEPKTRNTLSLGMMKEILSALTQSWDDKQLRCIVISSTGPIWSSGHDLKELLPERGEDQQKAIFDKLTEIIFSIRKAPVPVMAKVNGTVAAGGVQLVASCDIVICSDKSSFITPSANFGVFASTPAIAMSRIMSHSKCLDMLMTGHPITARDAYIQGMVSRVVPESELDNEIVKITNAIKEKSRAVLALGKEFFYKQLELSIEEAYKLGSLKMTENLKLSDSQEGVKSFMEKRKPVWSHL